MRKLLIISLTLFSFSANAGREGGGGNIIACSDQNGVKLQILDYWQAEKRNFNLDLGPANLSYMDKVQLVLKRIEKLNPDRYELYSKWAQNFFSDTFWESDTTARLSQIDDIGALAIPGNCSIIQVISQQDSDLPDDKRYTVLLRWWDQLDNDNKAGLVLHEIILRELTHQALPPSTYGTNIDVAHQTSKYARYFNGLISSSKISNMKLRDYIETLVSAKFLYGQDHLRFSIETYPIPDYFPYCPYGVCKIEFWDENKVKTARRSQIEKGREILWYGAKIHVLVQEQSKYFNDGMPETLYILGNQTFTTQYTNGSVKLELNKKPLEVGYKHNSYGIHIESDKIYGRIICNSGKVIEIARNTKIEIDRTTGEVSSCK